MPNNDFHAFDVQNRKAYDDFSEVYQAYVGYENGFDTGFTDGLYQMFTGYAEETASPIKTILDCASGPGNPGLGLAKLGYDVYCCDLSPRMVETIKKNDTDNRLKDVRVASWYNLREEYRGMQFDAVVCACNAVMHIPSDEAFRCALENMCGVLRSEGICYIDYLNVKNDYSHYCKRIDGFSEFQHNGQVYITFRTYHFDEVKRWMTFTYYFGRDDGTGKIKSWIEVPVAGRPILTEELRDLATASGFSKVRTKGVKRLGIFAEFNAIIAIK
jgi:SAM-dependent methyltransferase